MSVPQTKVTLDLSDGAAPVEVTGWTVSRELTGVLPGQARAGSGVAAATASVSFRVPDGRTPWAAGGPVLPGGSCAIDAAEDVGLPLVPAARMTIRAVSASGAMTPERTADLEDTGITQKLTLPTLIAAPGETPFDAACAMDLAARAMGYYQTPPPVASAIFSQPMCGSARPEVGAGPFVATIASSSWATASDGRIYGGTAEGEFTLTSPISVGSTVYLTVDLVTTTGFTFDLGTSASVQQLYVNLTSSGVIAFYWGDGGVHAGNIAVSLGLGRVQLKITRAATSTTIVARNTAGGAWSSTLTTSYSSDDGSPWSYIAQDGAAQWRGLQIHTADDAAVWAAPTAQIAATGSVLGAILPGAAQTAWGLVQDVAGSTLGAAWIDGSGTLVYRNKEAMRGSGAIVGTIQALASIVDLPWSISTDDVADRVEVDYSPPVISTGIQNVTVWQATDTWHIPVGTTSHIITLDGATGNPAGFQWFGHNSLGPDSQFSRCIGNSNPDGTGSVVDFGLSVQVSAITPTTIKLTFVATTPMYLVDTSGNPAITLRSSVYAAAPDQASSVYSGASENDALNPLTFDCGAWVQDSATAASFQSWLAGMVASPLPTLSQVQIVPNSAVRMGDVWRVVDPLYTGLSAKCLVTGTVLTGAPGSLTQSIDLVVLGASFADVDAYIASLGVVTYADLDTQITTALGSSPTFAQVEAWLTTGAS